MLGQESLDKTQRTFAAPSAGVRGEDGGRLYIGCTNACIACGSVLSLP